METHPLVQKHNMFISFLIIGKFIDLIVYILGESNKKMLNRILCL